MMRDIGFNNSAHLEKQLIKNCRSADRHAQDPAINQTAICSEASLPPVLLNAVHC